MKKLISLLLTFALVMSLSITAFAETVTTSPAEATAQVTGTYVPGTTASGIVYSVDIEWENMNFTYHAEKAPVWNTTSHTYSEKADAYWEGEGTIKVTNHSNTKIKATPAYAAATGYESASVTFDPALLRVASAVDTNAAVTGSIAVTPTGSLPSTTTDGATIGSITLTIEQDVDVTEAEITELHNKIFSGINFDTAIEAGTLTSTDRTALQTAMSSLDMKLTDFKNGTATQDELNTSYNYVLNEYNKIIAKLEAANS